MSQALERLCKALDYRFTKPELLISALTHRSVGRGNYERLEFLGDAVLSFVVSSELYSRFPHLDEGKLSRLRASLVNGESLAAIARDLDLGEYLKLGSGELKSGGFRRASILADSLEAVIGAVYLDSGIESAQSLILGLYGERLKNVSPVDNLKDPKTRLQEYLQSRRLPLPQYEVLSVSGDPHDQTFVVTCLVEGLSASTQGIGCSRRKAEQAAAAEALRVLEQ